MADTRPWELELVTTSNVRPVQIHAGSSRHSGCLITPACRETPLLLLDGPCVCAAGCGGDLVLLRCAFTTAGAKLVVGSGRRGAQLQCGVDEGGGTFRVLGGFAAEALKTVAGVWADLRLADDAGRACWAAVIDNAAVVEWYAGSGSL